jgi:hypothetical protein
VAPMLGRDTRLTSTFKAVEINSSISRGPPVGPLTCESYKLVLICSIYCEKSATPRDELLKLQLVRQYGSASSKRLFAKRCCKGVNGAASSKLANALRTSPFRVGQPTSINEKSAMIELASLLPRVAAALRCDLRRHAGRGRSASGYGTLQGKGAVPGPGVSEATM